jgi:hypothetical protein
MNLTMKTNSTNKKIYEIVHNINIEDWGKKKSYLRKNSYTFKCLTSTLQIAKN